MIHVFGFPIDWLLPLLALICFLALYVIAPLKIRKTQTKDIDVHFIPAELTDLPGEVAPAFYVASNQLASCGFRSLGTVRQHLWNTGQNGFISLWVNETLLDSIQIIGICTPSHVGGWKVVTLVTFRSEFTDGTSIVTSNSPSASVFPPDRRLSSVRCPGVYDIALIHRFHRARVERDRGKRQATLDRASDPVSRLRMEHKETFERMIAAGYFAIDETGLQYVATYKGAYLMAYKLLPPFKQIQKIRKDRAVNRTLRELGFGGLRAFRKSQSIFAPLGQGANVY